MSGLAMCQQMADIQQEGYNQGMVDGTVAVTLTQKETDITDYWNTQMNTAYSQWSNDTKNKQGDPDADYKVYQEYQMELQTETQLEDSAAKPATGQATLDQTYQQNWLTAMGFLNSVNTYLAQSLQKS